MLLNLLRRGLADTGDLWPSVARGFRWVHFADNMLANEPGWSSAQVRVRYRGSWVRCRAGSLTAAVNHFLKDSRSYWLGLFHCHDIDGLPRTDNDLENQFGAFRYHERRASKRIAADAARQHMPGAEAQAIYDDAVRRDLRHALNQRRQSRIRRRRFCRDSAAYLGDFEARLIKLISPPWVFFDSAVIQYSGI